MNRLQNLADFARSHGFNTAIQDTFVLVWDRDGALATKSYSALREWMGY